MQASARPDTMPAFRPLKTRATVLLLGGAEWGKVALAAALGALLAFSLGAIKHVEEVPMGNSERMAQVAELEQVRATVKSLDSRMKAAGAASLSAIDVTDSERQDAERAAELGRRRPEGHGSPDDAGAQAGHAHAAQMGDLLPVPHHSDDRAEHRVLPRNDRGEGDQKDTQAQEGAERLRVGPARLSGARRLTSG